VCTARSTDFCALGYECSSGACVTAGVPCGGTTCQVANGNDGCCISGDGQTTGGTSFACLTTPTGTCDAGHPYKYSCDSRADCPSDSVCCMGQSNSATLCNYFGGVCTKGTACPPSNTGGHYYQLCSPTLSPTECVSGTCKTFTQCPALGLYNCQ
jgi:hypothetical protein